MTKRNLKIIRAKAYEKMILKNITSQPKIINAQVFTLAELLKNIKDKNDLTNINK